MPKISIPAPAKLNLHLHIGERRADGFHDIESLFLALAFGDIVRCEAVSYESANSSLRIDMDWQLGGVASKRGVIEALPPEKNIVSRAVSLFRSHTGYNQGLIITVEKRIPLGGGLGGGSSDAAATLIALNRLAGAGDGAISGGRYGLLNDSALIALGATLGSDVPFFLYGASLARVCGRGELVQPLPLPESMRSIFLVLVNPGTPSDTAGAYRLLDEFRGANSACCNHLPSDMVKLTDALSLAPQDWPFANDFLPAFQAGAKDYSAFSELCTNCQLVFSQLRELGAGFVGLSGSGSTCFGVFPDRSTAELAQVSLETNWPYVIVTFPLAYAAERCYNSKWKGTDENKERRHGDYRH